MFLGNKSDSIANINAVIAVKEEIIFAFSEVQRPRFTVPSRFDGHLYLFLVTNQWHKYDALKSINLPTPLTYSDNSISQLGRTIHEESLEPLMRVILTTRLFFDCVVEFTNQSTQSSVDTESISQVSNFLAENVTQTQPTLAELTHLTNMSISSLKIKFKTQPRKSVKDFFIEKKMDYTRKLLK
ncbi:MAG: AraC-like DNA-binding protein [Spirosomataceae bacterium]|jgi:hypothetical protein